MKCDFCENTTEAGAITTIGHTNPTYTIYVCDACSPAERMAAFFHERYERLAPHYSYTTREASAKPWEDVPEENKRLMIAVCRDVLTQQKWTGGW